MSSMIAVSPSQCSSYLSNAALVQVSSHRQHCNDMGRFDIGMLAGETLRKTNRHVSFPDCRAHGLGMLYTLCCVRYHQSSH